MARYAYIGCRTTKERDARGKGISVYRADEKGNWELIQVVEGLINPSYLCMDRRKQVLYTVHGDKSEVSCFAVEKETGKLTYVNSVSTGGINPVHLSVDRTNRWLFAANLQTGTVAVIPVESDGRLRAVKELYTISGDTAGTISHPHQVEQDNTGNYLVVSCQGRKEGFGQVDVFRIHSDSGELERTCVVRARQIAEPRHVVFHSNNAWCYGVNEKDCTVTVYDFDDAHGILKPKQIVPVLPDTYTGEGWASGITITEDGMYVMVSDRKHNSVTSFRVQEDGKLKFCDCVETGGEQPRYIMWDKQDNCVVAANERTDSIVKLGLDRKTGKMKTKGEKIDTESPVCVIFDKQGGSDK